MSPVRSQSVCRQARVTGRGLLPDFQRPGRQLVSLPCLAQVCRRDRQAGKYLGHFGVVLSKGPFADCQSSFVQRSSLGVKTLIVQDFGEMGKREGDKRMFRADDTRPCRDGSIELATGLGGNRRASC